MSNSTTVPFWRQPVASLYQQVGGNPAGLTTAEAARRLSQLGPNAQTFATHRRLLRKIARRFSEPLIAILIVAAAISGMLGDLASFGIVASVIVLSITLDVFQEHRAELAADALRRSVAVYADVRRDGTIVSIPVEQVVPGDIVELRAGDLVPADGIIIQSRGAHVDESLLTGEPFPVEKHSGDSDAAEANDAFNAVFAGTSVVSGEITMLAVFTGSRTQFGGIAAALETLEPPSSLEQGLHRLGLLILRLTLFLVLFVLLAQLVFRQPALDSFLFALALAVGLTPELLPMIMTVTLARGALRMAKKSVIVKRLAAIHDIGAMDVLCTDKTGTLTEARIALVAHLGANGTPSDRTLALAAINSSFSSGIRSPLDQAIIDRMREDHVRGWRKLDEIPFDFERRCVTILAEYNGARALIIKGAAERLLARSTHVDTGDGTFVQLEESVRSALEHTQAEQAALGNRLLAVAWKPMPQACGELRPDDESDLVFAGYCVFVDPPKAGAAAAIARLEAAGVRVKVVSGDHDAVVRHVVDTLRIPARNLLTGAEIDELTDTALAARVDEVDLFARVVPEQKTRIIRALQARGHVVGFLGDGVNDAPAIRAAEIGLSVDSATDVARSAADMIMLSRELGVLADGVEEGRRTFANILKYVRMGTSSNFGNMLSMAVASLLLPFLPLLPVQILLNNLLYDLSEIGIPFDEVDQQDLDRPRGWDMPGILRFTLIMGALSSVFDIATFAMLIGHFDTTPDQFRTAWFIESTATQILVIFVIRTRRPSWRSRVNPLLLVSSLGAIGVAIALVATPAGALFGFVGLSAGLCAAITAVVIAYLTATECTKAIAMRPTTLHANDDASFAPR